MWSTLQLDTPPDIGTGSHCTKPYRCSFDCHQEGGQPYISPALPSRLGEITFPAGFLDFETVSPAIPPLHVPTNQFRSSGRIMERPAAYA